MRCVVKGLPPATRGGRFRAKIPVQMRRDGTSGRDTHSAWVSYKFHSFGQLQVQVNARTLLAHANADYEEWGYNTSIEYQPGANGQGLLLKLGSAWGMDQSGVQSMWSQETARGLARGGPMSTGQRYQAELGYGVKTRYRERFWYPYLAAESFGDNNQAYRLGLKLTSGAKLEAGLEFGQRLGLPGEKPENAIALRGEFRF